MRSPGDDRRTSSTFSALRYQEFRLLFVSLTTSFFGEWMQQFAVGWLLVELAVRDGNPALGGFYLGLRSLASAVPALAFGFVAGVYADRIDRRRLLIVTRLAAVGVDVTLAALVITDHVNLAVVMVLSAVGSAAFAFEAPGRWAMLPNVVPLRQLFSALGLSRASMQTAHAIGPLIAGLLIVPIGVGGVLLAKAGLLVGSVATLLPMKPQPVAANAGAVSVFSSLREGMDYIRHNDIIRWCVVLHLVITVLGQAFMGLLPAVAVDTLHVGAVELSWLTAASGLGALAGAFLVAGLGDVTQRGRLLLSGMLALGALLVLFGLQRDVLGAVVVLTAVGVAQQLFLGMHTVTLQLTTPDRLRGRVMGMQSLVFLGTGPVGVFILGTLGTFIGISNALLLGGVGVVAVSALVALRVPVIRNLTSGATVAPVDPAGHAGGLGESPAEGLD